MRDEPCAGLEALMDAELTASHLVLHTDRGDWEGELCDGLRRLLAPLADRISDDRDDSE
jgi:hypothetical protein